jgi:hypothetical protein
MIAFVLIEAYKESLPGRIFFENLIITVPLTVMLFFFILLIIGRIDTLLGLREEELRNASTSNPVMREILRNVEEIRLSVEELYRKK